MNLSDLVINGTKIQWSRNFGWIRAICKQEIEARKEIILSRIAEFTKSAPNAYFGNRKAEEKILTEAGTMLEYKIKAKYLEDKDEARIYNRFSWEKDETYEIFCGFMLSHLFPKVEDVAVKILAELEKRGD